MTLAPPSPIDSDKDETTVVTRVGMPAVPPEYKDTHFERMVTVMATFVEEVRGYRADLAEKEKKDDTNWENVKHEIAGVRSDFGALKNELEQFRAGLRREVDEAKRESEGKIKLLEDKICGLEREVERINTALAAIESGRDPRDRVTLVPPVHGTPAAKTF